MPALVVLGGTGHFFVIVYKTWTSQLPVWKESLYPTMMYGLGEESQKLLASADSSGLSKGAERVRDEMLLRFDVDDDEGFGLRIVEPSTV